MFDISNKLHALVDEFVSNLSSECDSLANTVSAHAQLLLGNDITPAGAVSQRSSNRTAAEVLIGLKRPAVLNVTNSLLREDKLKMMQANANPKEGTIRNRDGGRRPHSVELLSSDGSSDDGRLPAIKHPKKTPGNQPRPKLRNSRPRRSSHGVELVTPLRSPESSHTLDYSYDGDTKSEGAAMIHHETTPQKLRWPEHAEDREEAGGVGNKSTQFVANKNKESHRKSGKSKRDDDNTVQGGESSNEDDIGHNLVGTDSEGEELPVLPKIPVKRRLLNETKPHERRIQRGRPKSTSPQIKKPKTPQIDASVITQLEFGRRPANSVSNSILCL